MLKKITISTSAVIMMSLAIPAAACDFHGGGFGAFGIPGATIKRLNHPKVILLKKPP